MLELSNINYRQNVELLSRKEFYLERPLWVRDGVMMLDWMSHQVVDRIEVLRQELNVNPYSNDWSGFRNGHWVNRIRQGLTGYFQKQLEENINIDWNFSSTGSLLEVYLEILRLRQNKGLSSKPRIYFGSYADGWKLSEIESVANVTGEIVDKRNDADILLLTHGTPFLGMTSLDDLDLNTLREDQFVILDAAFGWSSLFTKQYSEAIKRLISRGKCAITGDFHKYAGYAFSRADGFSSTNFSFTLYSDDLFGQRLRLAGEPELEKSDHFLDHFRLVSSRNVISGFPAYGVLPPAAFFDLFGPHIPQWIETSLSVAARLRNHFGAEGGITNILWQIQPDSLMANSNGDSFSVYSNTLRVRVENVLPTIPMNGALYGYVHVPPIYGLLGEERLFDMYSQIITHFQQRDH